MREPLRRQVGRALLIAGGLALVACLGVLIDATLFQQSLSRRLEALGALGEARPTLSRAAATRREAKASGLVGQLEIQRLDLSVMVVEGTGSGVLARGVGHVPGTAFPGERGNVGLAGHRDTYFRPLRNIRSGDRITLRTPDGRFVYRVDRALVVSPRRADLLRGDQRARLTLVTCYPFYYIGPAPRRFVVQAHQLEPDRHVASVSRSKAGGLYVASAMR